MTDSHELTKQLKELRTRLMGDHTPEELQSMKTKIDALEGLRRLGGQHDDDTDDSGHHHHEHFTN